MTQWIAILLAILAIALAAYVAYQWFNGSIKETQVTGLDSIKATAVAANARSVSNETNLDSINVALGDVDTATTGFSALASPAVPTFPLVLA